MATNWKKGIRRAHYFILAIIWIFMLSISASGGAANVGLAIGYMLMFTLGYMVFFMAADWVIRGFSSKS